MPASSVLSSTTLAIKYGCCPHTSRPNVSWRNSIGNISARLMILRKLVYRHASYDCLIRWRSTMYSMFCYWNPITNLLFSIAYVPCLRLLSLIRTKISKSKISSIQSELEKCCRTSSNGKDIPMSENSWEPATHVKNLSRLVKAFHNSILET